MKYPNPCNNCTAKVCNYRTCAVYIARVNTIWKQFNGYTARAYRKYETMKREKFVYEHPDIIRRYLAKGPCDGCKRELTCQAPCPAYWRWWDARMEWVRMLLRKGKRNDTARD